MPPTIFISAGEASGEHYGALLVTALQTRLAAAGQTAQFFGMGGARMEAAGLEVVVRSEEMAVMGLTEVVRHLPRIYREFRRLKQAVRDRRPSVAVLIDFPEIHFRLAKELHRLGIPVVYFVSPQLWAWKKGRIKLVRKYIDRMLVIFPFEEQFYRQRGIEAEFVGHPLAELPLPADSREQFAAENALDSAKTWIGLLPGSRPKEIRDHLPEMLRAALLLTPLPVEQTAKEQVAKEVDPVKGTGFSPYITQTKLTRALAPEGCSAETSFDSTRPIAASESCMDAGADRRVGKPQSAGENREMYLSVAKAPLHTEPLMYGLKPVPFITGGGFEFVLPLASTLNAAQRDEVRQLVQTHGSGLTVRLVDDLSAEGAVGPTAGGARAALHHARAAVVASGTATVEAALIGNPFVVVYRVSTLTYAIAKRLVKVPHVAMANLIAAKRVVPELIQSDFTAENIVQQIERLLPDGPPRQSMMEELARICGLLHPEQREIGAIDRVAAITLEKLGFCDRS
jgi:lipid A disaccharide synthetase